MRSLHVVILLCLTLLAGCVEAPNDAHDQDASSSEPISPQWDNTTRIPFLSGTYTWHEPTNDPLELYDAATQNVAQPCLFQGEDDEHEKPYFNNLQLTPEPPEQAVLPGTTHIETTLTWADDDWNGDALYMTWIGGNATTYRISPPIPNGETTLVPIQNTTWNHNQTRDWDIWLCITGGGSATPEETTFVGDVDVELQLARETDT